MTDLTTCIVIGGRDYEKPYDPACAACTSPYASQLDNCLAYGWAFSRIRKYLTGLSQGASLSTAVLRSHIEHLAPPHYQARLDHEKIVTDQGGDADELPPPDAAALARITLQRAYERVMDGSAEVGPRDAVAILKIKREIEHDIAQEGERASAAQWEAAMADLIWIARKHLGRAWMAFAADVRASESIAAVTLDYMTEPPEPKEVPGGDAAQSARPGADRPV